MNLTEAAGGSATVEISERVFTLNPISNREEGLLGVQWEAIAVASVKQQDAETMAFIDSCPSAEGRKAMYQTLAEKKIAREPPSNFAIFSEARRSPDGIAAELFARTRKAHPELRVEDFQALLNPHNAAEAFDAILEALKKINPKGQTPSN